MASTNTTTKAATSDSVPPTAGGYLRSTGDESSPVPRQRQPDLSDAIITVQPTKRSDLQPSYAQILEADPNDASTTGWYGAMSKYPSQHMTYVAVC